MLVFALTVTPVSGAGVSGGYSICQNRINIHLALHIKYAFAFKFCAITLIPIVTAAGNPRPIITLLPECVHQFYVFVYILLQYITVSF